MSVHLKPIEKQVVFITGATTGIGKITAKLAADKGASVFLVDRNEDELQLIHNEMQSRNLSSAFAVANIEEVDQLSIAADRCIDTFGTIDTWINNPGFSIYGRTLETDNIEARTIFDTHFWSVVNGTKTAVSILRMTGGALINIGKVEVDVGHPVQGFYKSAKEAVKAYTETVRKEIEEEKIPVAVSLVTSSSLNAAIVAEAILNCAQNSTKEKIVKDPSERMKAIKGAIPRLKARWFADRF